MNANELAKLLEVDSWYKLVTREEIATMLRQQQAEIEALKQSKSDGNNKVNSKPVAWAVWEGSVHDMFFTKEDADELCRLKGGDAKSVPLYTHQVSQYKAITNTKIEPTVVSYTHPKELTDEEITACMGFLPKYNSEIVDEDLVNFARAILKRAFEK